MMGSNHRPTKWNTERDARLTEMHGQKDEPSFAIMAAKISAECGIEFTRNALIGRARRLDLAKRIPSNQLTFAKQTLGRKPKQPPKPRQRYSNESKRIITIYESREVLELHCAEVFPLNISLMDLDTSDCRWPYGELPEIKFCGHPKNDVSSYCGLHFALSKRRMT